MTVEAPSHAYVPGQSTRHPEAAFEAIRKSVQPGMSVDELARSAAFQSGLGYLEDGYFWEAHEVLEPVWMALPEGSEERQFVQGLIQLANALLKARMARPKAAVRLCGMAEALLTGCDPSVMGVDRAGVLARIDSLRVKMASEL